MIEAVFFCEENLRIDYHQYQMDNIGIFETTNLKDDSR